MSHKGLEFSREHEMEIFYKGEEIGTRRVQLEDVHLAQAINYLEAYKNGYWFAHKFWKYIITIQKSYEAE